MKSRLEVPTRRFLVILLSFFNYNIIMTSTFTDEQYPFERIQRLGRPCSRRRSRGLASLMLALRSPNPRLAFLRDSSRFCRPRQVPVWESALELLRLDHLAVCVWRETRS